MPAGPSHQDLNAICDAFQTPLRGLSLTTKERRVFEQGNRNVVTVRGEGLNALTYVLLHESTHVVDATLGLTKSFPGTLTKGVWMDRATPVVPLRDEAAMKTTFRGSPPLPATSAFEVYRSLSRTPFVSLYSTASSSEDLAELVSWYVVETQYNGRLAIEVTSSNHRVITFEPLKFPGVTARLRGIQELLSKRFRPSAY